MTYGEAHRAELDSVELVKGVFKKTLRVDNKPKPMDREEAVRHYNTKLYLYWLSQLEKEKTKNKKLNAIWLKIMMFQHPDNAKLNKGV